MWRELWDHAACLPPPRFLSLLTTWPSCADGLGPASCPPCWRNEPGSCCWPPTAPPTPRSPSGSGSRGRPSSPAAAGMCAAAWTGCPTGPGRAGRRPSVGPAAPRSCQVTLNPPPARLGITHWSTRLLARELGVSRDTVARIWREYGVQPWRAETFKFSTDPQLAAKVHDVVGLYLHPPERAVVLCVDEKSQIQALERTQPVRRVWLDRPEQRTHDYLPAWHHDPVRRAGGRHRARHRPVRSPPPPPGVPGVPQAGRPAPTRAGGCT